jgi:hypothetical protein
MIPKSINEIQAADIDRLVANAVEEGSQLDYKQALVRGSRDDKKEFIADVCAFANTRGGDLVYGIEQNDAGIAHAVIPLNFNPDEETLRLENLITDCIEPKLFGVRIAAIQHGAGRVLVVRVPHSVQGIHRSKLDQHFWVRESKSKRFLDLPAIVSRIEGQLGRQEKLEAFLAERYAAALTGRLPLPMRPGPKAMVHIIPTIGFRPIFFAPFVLSR